jgi:hypothetical protein
VGGIDSAQAAWERITAGACLIQVYTGWIYGGPALVPAILEGLLTQLDRHWRRIPVQEPLAVADVAQLARRAFAIDAHQVGLLAIVVDPAAQKVEPSKCHGAWEHHQRDEKRRKKEGSKHLEVSHWPHRPFVRRKAGRRRVMKSVRDTQERSAEDRKFPKNLRGRRDGSPHDQCQNMGLVNFMATRVHTLV